MAGIQEADWKQIEKEYVFGIEVEGKLVYPSYRLLGEKYLISKTIINDRARSEGWEIKRESLRNKLAKKVVEKKLKQLVADKRTDKKNKTDIDLKNGQVTQSQIDDQAEEESEIIAAFDVASAKVADDHLKAAQQNITFLLIESQKVDPNKPNYIKPKEILDNIKAAREAQELYKNAIGERLPNTPFGKQVEENELDERIRELLHKRELDAKGQD